VSASLAAFDMARRKSVVVLSNSERDEDWNDLPDRVKNDFRDPRVGTYIPYAVVYDSKLEAPLAFLTYEELKSGDAERAYRKVIWAYREQGEQRSEPSGVAETDWETWTSVEGTSIEARARRLVGENLTLIRKNGRSLTVKLSQLDEASRERARELFQASP